MKLLLITGLLILSGCANTPTQLMDEKPTTVFTSKEAAKVTAECIARNAEERAALFLTRVRPAPDGGEEVVVRGISGDYVFATARIKQDGAGSRGELWSDTFSGSLFTSPQDKAAMLLRGCTN